MRAHTASLKQRALTGVLALALLLAGLLGLAHRTVHVPGHAPSQSQLQLQLQLQTVGIPGAHTVADALFGGHDDAQCRLYDQLADGAGMPSVPLVVLPVALPAATLAFFAGEAVACRAAPFHARGPPAAP